jgi:hypothetical protein
MTITVEHLSRLMQIALRETWKDVQ